MWLNFEALTGTMTMSTRAVYSFLPSVGSNEAPFHVYKHSDGYPSGAAEAIASALPYAWVLPRFEHDEFACAFIAGCRAARKASDDARVAKGYSGSQGGGTRLLATGDIKDVAPCDIEYRYEISCVKGKVHVRAFEVNAWDTYTEKQIFSNTLAKMQAKFKD